MPRELLSADVFRRIGPAFALLALAIVLLACGSDIAAQSALPVREDIRATPSLRKSFESAPSTMATVAAARVLEPASGVGTADEPEPFAATAAAGPESGPELAPRGESRPLAELTLTGTAGAEVPATRLASPTATATGVLISIAPPPPPTSTPAPRPTNTPAPVPASTPTPLPSPEPAPVPTSPPPPSAATAVPTLTATPPPAATPEPTAVPTPTATPPPAATPEAPPAATPVPVATTEPATFEVVCVFFDGVVPKTESDEYVAIGNTGGTAGNLAGWTLIDGADGRPTFVFPDFVLSAGETIRVYTDEVHPEYGGFSFGHGSAIWNNSDPDRADLKNPDGDVVSSMSYPPSC